MPLWPKHPVQIGLLSFTFNRSIEAHFVILEPCGTAPLHEFSLQLVIPQLLCHTGRAVEVCVEYSLSPLKEAMTIGLYVRLSLHSGHRRHDIS